MPGLGIGNMRIAIIGCGYVGSALAIKLRKNGHYVTTTTRSHSKTANLKAISDDVCILKGNDCEALKNLLQNQHAAILTLAADSQESYEDTYLDTAKALSNIISEIPQLSQIVYTSSTSVYGNHQGLTVDENTHVSSLHPTGQILISAEKILMDLSYKERSVCILRLGEIYGPNRQIAERLRQMKGKSLPGDGSSMTNLIHLDDIVAAINFALTQRLNGVFNLCSDIHIPRRDLYAQICQKEGLPAITWDPTKASLHSGNKVVSNAKIKLAGFNFLHTQAKS